MIREYPAYARTIASLIVRGQKPICVAVLLSSRWHYFDHVPKVCIRPDEWAAGRYEFGYLRGLHAVAVPGDDCQDEQLGELLVELMRAGPALLWAFNANGSKLYDGQFADDLTHHAFNLLGKRVPFKELRSLAEAPLRAAYARASNDILQALERLNARGDIDGTIALHHRAEAIKNRVRELFSSPDRAPSEARVA